MQGPYAVSGYWNGDADEAGLQLWVGALRSRLSAAKVSLGVVFLTPHLFDRAAPVLEILRVHGQIPLLVGCSTTSLIHGGEELEEARGLVLALLHLPRVKLQALHFRQSQVEEANGPAYWHMETGIGPDQTNGWLVFADPYHLDPESWLRGWNEAYAPLPTLGGLASGEHSQQRTQVYLQGDVFEEGAVALSVGGGVELAGVVSQGCSPIGETWTITRAQQNFIVEIGNRPAYQVLAETFNRLSPDEKRKAHGNLFVGLAVNEYLEDFHRGDFLIRNLLAADPHSGTLAVGAWPRTGQTMQFQRRDAEAASEDLAALLRRAHDQFASRAVYGACLCCCSGRGQRMFGRPHHDAALVQTHLGPLGLAGFFCNGEIGPVGERNFLHGFTASLGLFVEKIS